MRENWCSGYVKCCFHNCSSFFLPKGSERFVQSKRTIKTLWRFQKDTFFQKSPADTKMYFWQPRSLSSVNTHKTYTQTASRKKTNLHKTSFNQNVMVDKTSILLTSLPKFFCKHVFAVSTRKLNICAVLVFLTRNVIFWTRRKNFWQPCWGCFSWKQTSYTQSPRKKKSQIFREIVPLKVLLWAIQVHIWENC